MNFTNTKPHPNLISNWTRKTQAKVGWMLMDIVSINKDSKQIEIPGIVDLSRKYHLGDKTFVKYLKKNIFVSGNAKNNKKILFLSETDVIFIKEIMYLEERYEKLDIAQKNLIKCLIAKLGRML